MPNQRPANASWVTTNHVQHAKGGGPAASRLRSGRNAVQEAGGLEAGDRMKSCENGLLDRLGTYIFDQYLSSACVPDSGDAARESWSSVHKSKIGLTCTCG